MAGAVLALGLPSLRADPVPTTPPPPAAPAFIRAVTPPAVPPPPSTGERAIVATWQVDAQGKVSDIRFAPSGSPRIDDAIRKTILDFRFRPRKEDGRPVPAMLSHTFLIDGGIPVTATSDRDVPTLAAPMPDLVLPGLMASDLGKAFTATWTVNPDGSATDIGVSPDASPALRDAILASIKRPHFLPATHNGKAITARMTHRYQIG